MRNSVLARFSSFPAQAGSKSKPCWLAVVIVILTACAQPPSTLIVTLPPPRGATVLPATTLAPALTPTALPPTEPPTLTPFPSATTEPSPTPSGEVMLMAVGDLMLARTVGEQILAQGPQFVFAGVQSTFDSADLLVGNLECAISDRG
ncbi:MAG: CapA family protein, partial [Chloroflexota bacterium]